MAAKIRLFTLVTVITGSVISIRNLPITATFGHTIPFYFLIAFLTFLLPVAYISSLLMRCWPDQAGIYTWTKKGLNKNFALLAIWLQWVNALIWLPTILIFMASTSAYLIDPNLALNKYYLVLITLLLNALLTWINLKGFQTSAKISAVCACSGTFLPAILIVMLALIWILSGKESHFHFGFHFLQPHLSEAYEWIALTAIIISFLGLELCAVNINDIHNPKRNFPIAMFIASLLILLIIMLGALSILVVLPQNQINIMNGVAETFFYFLSAFQLSYLLPIIVVMMIIGTFGGVINWIISPAKGLLQAFEELHLPSCFIKKNLAGVPSNLIKIQAMLVFIICTSFLLIHQVTAMYWFLIVLSAQLYILMYILFFLSALILVPDVTKHLLSQSALRAGNLRENFNKNRYILLAVLGLGICLTTFFINFFPPVQSHITSQIHYQLLFFMALIITILPILILGYYSKLNKLNDEIRAS